MLNQFNHNPWGVNGGGSKNASNFRIHSFESNIMSAEKGVETTPTFNWLYTGGDVKAQTINGIGLIPNSQRTATLSTPITDTTTFTLQASDGNVTRRSSLEIQFYHPMMIGLVDSELPIQSEILLMEKRVAPTGTFEQGFVINDRRTAIAFHHTIPRPLRIEETTFNSDTQNGFNIHENVMLTTPDGIHSYTVYIWKTIQNTMGHTQGLRFVW